MKNIFKLFIALSLSALIFVSCEPDDYIDDIDPDIIKAEKNRALYNQLFPGEWFEYDYFNNEFSAFSNAYNIEFNENYINFKIPSYGKAPINNFTTIFDYTDPLTKKKYTALEYGYYTYLPHGDTRQSSYHGYINVNSNTIDYLLVDYFDQYNLLEISFYKKDESHSNSVRTLFKKKDNNNSNGGENGNIDIKGSYSFTVAPYTHTLAFNSNGTYSFTSGSNQSSQNKSGDWSITGSTLTLNTSSPASMSENFSVSSSGNSYTITLTGNNSVSQILSTFGVVSNSLTMTKTN